MKKIWLILMLSLLLLALAACGSQGIEQPGQPEGLAVDAYFPILDNVKYIYEGEGNEYAAYTAYNDYIAGHRLQQSIDNGGAIIARVYQIGNGQLAQVFSSGEAYGRENYLDQAMGEPVVLLMEPVIPGTTWTLPDGSVSTIVEIDAQVSTPSGDYQAAAVSTESEGNTLIRYFAPDIGLVQTVYISEGQQITSTLSALEIDAAQTRQLRLFYPDSDAEGICYQDLEIAFRTNDLTTEILAQAYKQVPEGAGKVFSPGAQINSLYADDQGIVHLDLNRAFVDEMNAGSGYEGLLLDSLAATFGAYYGLDKLLLTIEGQPYSSGHFEFQPGEYLEADLDLGSPLP